MRGSLFLGIDASFNLKFRIAEISIDDFETENDRNDFIEMISDEIGIMESLVDELTETINKNILERLKH